MPRGRPRQLPDPEPRPCKFCGTVFVPPSPKKRRQQVCTLVCQRSRALDKSGNAELARRTAVQRGDAQRGRGEGKFYVKRNGRHEHRLVMEEVLGRPLAPGEIVHHMDGNRRNNDPSNLMLLTRQSHINEHRAALEEGRRRKKGGA